MKTIIAVRLAGVLCLTITDILLTFNPATGLWTQRRVTKSKKYLRSGLQRPLFEITAWERLKQCGTETEFVVALSVPRSLFFNEILPLFATERKTWLRRSPFCNTSTKRGRKPFLRTVDLLGLALWYMKSADVMYSLCPIFGMVPSSVSQWLDYGLELLWNVVRNCRNQIFKIQWPTPDEMRESTMLLKKHRAYGPMLEGVFGVTDGARLKCPSFEDPDLQNAYYNAFTQEVQVVNLLVWNFKGEIIYAALNIPGSWHDSHIAAACGLYWPTLGDDTVTPPGFAILGDSAFVFLPMNGKVVRARKLNEMGSMPKSEGCRAIELVLQRLYPSERQCAEWGVRAMRSPFRRLSTTLPSDAYKRGRILGIACHLVNYRTRRVGYNQIRSVYNSPW